MKPIDVASLAESVSAEAPSGSDLEYDPDFVELEDAVRTEPEQQFGDTVIDAKGPEWVLVRDLAERILTRSKDLRAAVYLVQALVHGNGYRGLAQGLSLIRVLLEKFWSSLHPQLDRDDDLDPTERVNFIANLCDSTLILIPVRHAPMVQIPGLGGISLRDVQIAKGQLPPPPDGEETLKLDSIEAAIRDAELETVQDTEAIVEGAVRDLATIEQTLLEKVGVTHAVSLNALTDILQEVQGFLQEQLSARSDVESPDLDKGGNTMAAAGNGAQGSSKTERVSGQITCSQDVIKAIDMIIAYYKTNEPSSPVPLLLERSKRLVSVGFMEILRDIAPDALVQAEQVTGASSEIAD